MYFDFFGFAISWCNTCTYVCCYSKSTGLDVTSVMNLTLSEKYPDRIIMGLNDMGGFVSEDGGNTWKQNNYDNDGDSSNLVGAQKYNSYGSIYLLRRTEDGTDEERDLILSIWTGLNCLPIRTLDDAENAIGTIAISTDGGKSQHAINNILPYQSLPVAVKCLPDNNGGYNIYICCYGTGIYKFELNEERLTADDSSLIEDLKDSNNWTNIVSDGFGEISSISLLNESAVMENIDENYMAAKLVADTIDYPWRKNFNYSDDMDKETEEGITLYNSGSNILVSTQSDQNGYFNNVYAYDIVTDNNNEVYAIECNPEGYPKNSEISNTNKGGIYKLADGIWERIELPNENAIIPTTVAFDDDNSMYVGFIVSQPDNINSPFSWIGGGVYKKCSNSTEWELISSEGLLDGTNSITKLVYDKENDRMYICGFNMGLLCYENGTVSKINGYDFTSTNNVVINGDILYVCTRGNGVWIGINED